MKLLPHDVRQILIQLEMFIVILKGVDVVSNSDQGAGRAREVLAQDVESDIKGLISHGNQIPLQVRIGIGYCLGKPDLFLVLIELVDETEGKVILESLSSAIVVVEELICAASVSISLSRDLILKVFDIFAPSEPLLAPESLPLLGIDAYLHPHRVETLRLCQVEDVELNSLL